MAKKMNPGKKSYWRDVLGRYEESGLSIRKFCAQESVSQNSFYTWRRKLADRDSKASQHMDASNSRSSPDVYSEFIPVQMTDVGSSLELTHPAGYRLRIPANFHPTVLRQVLEVLDAQED